MNETISRKAVLDGIEELKQSPWFNDDTNGAKIIRKEAVEIVEELCVKRLPSVTPQPKTGHCKDCKWWKDSDGAYRRGVGAESQCPINRRDVFDGNGYCYMFEPQESEDK